MHRIISHLRFVTFLAISACTGCGSGPTDTQITETKPTESNAPASAAEGPEHDSTVVSQTESLEDADPRADADSSALKIAPPIIGQLRGRNHTIIIHSASDGPRFTLTKPDGKVIAAALTADEISAKYPEIYKAYEKTFADQQRYLDASITPPLADPPNRPPLQP